MNKFFILLSYFCPILAVAQLNYNSQHNYPLFETDGVYELSETESESALFVQHDNGNAASNQVKSSIIWTGSGLYLGFDVKDTDILGTQANQDADIYAYDDLIEFFIDPDGDGQNYLEVGVNCYGVYYDYIIHCPGTVSCGSWSSDIAHDLPNIEVAATFNGTPNNSNDVDEGFQVEVFIPYSDLMNIPNGGFSIPQFGDTWNINLFNIDYGTGTPTEYLSWNPHYSFGFHQPTKFGTITFKDVIQSNKESTSVASNLYPNPTQGKVHFQQELPFQVLSMQGVILQEGINNHIDLEGLPTGLYLIKTDLFLETIIKK